MASSKKVNVALWTAQGLLGLFFALGSGAPKLFIPAEMLNMPIPLPQMFVYFIGLAEILGGIGLILPGLTHTRTGLTSLAALGLVVLTLCATVYQLAGHQPESAVFAFVMSLLVASVGYGRWRVAPLRSRPVRRVALATSA